ncbi:MAG: hypothetical protein J6A54_01915 [Clostridia bacterium]|nr:hypothetical protein [Clostridia bacterium]
MKKRIVLMLFVLVALVMAFASCGHDCEYEVIDALSTAPTCVDPGTIISKCKECDEETTEIVPALGHDYVETVIAPTCSKEGHTEKVCSRCSDKQITNKVSATNEHNYEIGETKAPTCTTAGYDVKRCKDCGEEIRANQVAALDHDYVKVVKWDNDIVPNCVTAGSGWEFEECTRCKAEKSASKTKVTKELGSIPHDRAHDEAHELKSAYVPATCQTEEYRTYYCLVCQEPERVKTGDKKACDFTQDGPVILEATCYNTAIQLRTCAFSDHTTNNTKEVPVGVQLPHQPNVAAADCATDMYCKLCAAREGVIPGNYGTQCDVNDPNCSECTFNKQIHLYARKTNAHSGEIDAKQKVAPTCVAQGKNYRVCSNLVGENKTVCGHVYEDDTPIPIDPEAHQLNADFDKEGGEDKITPETCIAYAYKSQTCTLGCGYVKKTTLPERGFAPHTFTNAEHTGTISCEYAGCTATYYDIIYSSDILKNEKVEFVEGSSLQVLVTGTKTDSNQDNHLVLKQGSLTSTLTPDNADDKVKKGITVIYIEADAGITVTAKINGQDTVLTPDANGYIHLNRTDIEISEIVLTATLTDENATAKVYFYSDNVIINNPV